MATAPVLAIASTDEPAVPGRSTAVPNRDRRRSSLAPPWPWLLRGRQFQTNRAMREAFIARIPDVRSVALAGIAGAVAFLVDVYLY